jgi:putative transposase
MADHNNPHSSQRRYPPELRERAVRMVFATIEQTGERFGAITRGARQLGIGSESLRSWCAKPRSTAASGPGDHHRAAAHRRAGAGGPGAPPHRRDPQVGVGFLRGRAGRPSPAMTRYIEVHRDRFGPGPICRVLQVAPVHLLRPAEPPPSARVVRDEQLKVEIRRVWDANYRVYGPRRSGGSLHGKGSRSAATGWPGWCANWASVGSCGVASGAPPSRPRSPIVLPTWSIGSSPRRRLIACGLRI